MATPSTQPASQPQKGPSRRAANVYAHRADRLIAFLRAVAQAGQPTHPVWTMQHGAWEPGRRTGRGLPQLSRAGGQDWVGPDRTPAAAPAASDRALPAGHGGQRPSDPRQRAGHFVGGPPDHRDRTSQHADSTTPGARPTVRGQTTTRRDRSPHDLMESASSSRPPPQQALASAVVGLTELRRSALRGWSSRLGRRFLCSGSGGHHSRLVPLERLHGQTGQVPLGV